MLNIFLQILNINIKFFMREVVGLSIKQSRLAGSIPGRGVIKSPRSTQPSIPQG